MVGGFGVGKMVYCNLVVVIKTKGLNITFLFYLYCKEKEIKLKWE